MESRFGVDFSGVRVHTDHRAADSADALSANAYTMGRDIYFAAGKYSPASRESRHLLAHELTHTIQQTSSRPALESSLQVSSPEDPLEQQAERVAEAVVGGAPAQTVSAGDVMLARDAAPQPYSTSSALEPSSTSITAEAWVAKHARNLVGKVGYELSLAELPITTPFVAWKNGQRREFLIDFWQPFWVGLGGVWPMFAGALAPDKPATAVAAGRDSYPWDFGTSEWRQPVVGEFYKLFMLRLTESLARILPRWRSVKNQLALRLESGDEGANRDPSTSEVFGSHPIDSYVIKALAGKLEIDYKGYRKAFPEAARQHEIRSGLRPVVFQFQIAAGAWNWIRVDSPANAAPEEVAKALYGNETKAYLLTSAPPLFGFDDVYDLLPVQKKRFYTETSKGGAVPTRVSGSQEKTPTHQILAGPLGDEAALLQAKKIKGTAIVSPAAVLDRMRVIVRTLDGMVSEAAKVGLGLLTEPLKLTRDRVSRRSVKLANASPAEVSEWDPQSRGQLELVNAAESGLLVATEQQKTFAGWPSVKNVIHSIGTAYSRVAQSSDLVETGRYWLNFAEEQSRLFPVTLMDLLLAELRRALLSVSEKKERVDLAGAQELEKKLRAKLVKVRDVVLQHPEQAKAALEPLFKEIADLQVEVTLVTNIDQCDRAWQALYDSLSVTGAMRSLWGGGNELVSAAALDASRLSTEWNYIYIEFKYGDKEKAKKQLKEKSASPEWAGFMERIRQVITDQATYDKWMTFAVMVGIAVLTAGIGAYVEAAAGAAWGAAAGFGAATVVEAATFTALSYSLIAKDPSISGFFEDFGKNLLTFGALRTISRIYRLGVGAEAAASASGKAGDVLVQFVALNGAALYQADQEKRKKTGQGLTITEIGEISLYNLGFVVAVSIGAKLAEPWITGMRLTGELQGNLAKIESTRTQLLDLSKAVQATGGKKPALARRMLAKQAELLALQEQALMRLEQIAADPKSAAAAGLSSKQIESITAARAQFGEALEQIHQAHIASQLESVGANEFLCPKGEFFDGLSTFFKKQGAVVNDKLPRDPVTNTRSIKVTPKEGTPFRVTERLSTKTGEVGRSAEMRPEGEPTGGRWGFSGDLELFLNDPNPAPEVLDARERVLEAIKKDEWMLKYPHMVRSRIQLELAKLRLDLVKRRKGEVSQVADVLRTFGIKGATPTAVNAIFGYLFQSAGISLTYENYAAWSRLARGQGTIGDVRFMVHEIAEVAELKKSSFDFMGKKLEIQSPEHVQWYTEFEPRYLAAHSKALLAEYRFLAAEISKSTGHRVNLSAEITAAIDPTSIEAHANMFLADAGGGEHPLEKDSRFPDWVKRTQEQVDLSSTEAKRLGLPEKTTLGELLAKIKSAPLP
jgi:hypothetical protein